MLNKRFSQRLNSELDSIGVPEGTQERIDVLSKILKIPKFKAEALLNGITRPDEDIVQVLAQELEVDTEWLLGKTDSKTEQH